MSAARVRNRTRVEQILYDITDQQRQAPWLAGEIDDLDSVLTDAVHELRREMVKLRQVLTGLLISVILVLLTVPPAIFFRK